MMANDFGYEVGNLASRRAVRTKANGESQKLLVEIHSFIYIYMYIYIYLRVAVLHLFLPLRQEALTDHWPKIP